LAAAEDAEKRRSNHRLSKLPLKRFETGNDACTEREHFSQPSSPHWFTVTQQVPQPLRAPRLRDHGAMNEYWN
jgi:hypothetical protein